jgi:DNA repair protein RadC
MSTEIDMELSTITPIEALGPRERLAMRGAAALSDAELLAVLLGTGSSDEPVQVLAARMLENLGGLHGLARRGISGLAQLRGIGTSKACRIAAAIEVGARLQAQPIAPNTRLRSSRQVDAALRPRFRHESREHFMVIALDAKQHPLAELHIATGGLTACAFSPADVFRPVLRHAAACIVLAHNHPSGDPTPSDDDIVLTRKLALLGIQLGIRVVDHVILGHETYFSFLDAGLLSDVLGQTG